MRKPFFCICENKDADQLRGNREADQRLCFRYIDSTILLLPKYEISSFYPSCVVVQLGSFLTWSETPKTSFLTTRLIYTLLYSLDIVNQAGRICTLHAKAFEIHNRASTSLAIHEFQTSQNQLSKSGK